MSSKNVKAEEQKYQPRKPGYSPIGEEAKVWKQFLDRKRQLLSSRQSVYGLDIDSQMRRWDKLYFRRQADIPASELDPNQRPLAINNAFGKIQTAVSLLVDRNPKYILEADNPKYKATRALLKSLGEKSFMRTNSLGQLKLSIFNQAKRGWFVGRTYNRQIETGGRFLTGVDDRGRRAYDTRLVKKLDDVQYMNLSNYNTWLDEQTKPEDFYSTRDWMWREVWHIDDLRRVFPESEFPNMKHVGSGGDTRETIESNEAQSSTEHSGNSPQSTKPGMTELFFYENHIEDKFIVEMNNVMVVWEPLPQWNKQLSCTYGYWHLRGDDTPYGIGIVEEMENDEELIDRVLNMDMRQLLLTIAPAGFHNGTDDPEDENMKITPGVMRRVLDPKSITFLQIPEGNGKGLEKVQWLQTKQDDKTGITKAIEGGQVETETGTAFEAGLQREGGLKRLRLPLKSLQYALTREFDNRIALIQQTYSQYDVEELVDQEKINEFLKEVEEDKDSYYIDNEGIPGEEKFYAKKFREEFLSVEQAENGEYVESEQEAFFRIKPEMLNFKGKASVDIDSLLITSAELEKADTLRMVNLLAPLFAGPKETNAKLAKQLLQSHGKETDKWLPQDWIDFLAGKQQQPSSQDALALAGQAEQGGQPQPTLVPPGQLQGTPQEFNA